MKSYNEIIKDLIAFICNSLDNNNITYPDLVYAYESDSTNKVARIKNLRESSTFPPGDRMIINDLRSRGYRVTIPTPDYSGCLGLKDAKELIETYGMLVAAGKKFELDQRFNVSDSYDQSY